MVRMEVYCSIYKLDRVSSQRDSGPAGIGSSTDGSASASALPPSQLAIDLAILGSRYPRMSGRGCEVPGPLYRV